MVAYRSHNKRGVVRSKPTKKKKKLNNVRKLKENFLSRYYFKTKFKLASSARSLSDTHHTNIISISKLKLTLDPMRCWSDSSRRVVWGKRPRQHDKTQHGPSARSLAFHSQAPPHHWTPTARCRCWRTATRRCRLWSRQCISKRLYPGRKKYFIRGGLLKSNEWLTVACVSYRILEWITANALLEYLRKARVVINVIHEYESLIEF